MNQGIMAPEFELTIKHDGIVCSDPDCKPCVIQRKSVRNQLGSIWLEDLYFGVNGKVTTEVQSRPVSVNYYIGVTDMYRGMEESGGGSYFIFDNGEGIISYIMLDSRGCVWQITSLMRGPRK